MSANKPPIELQVLRYLDGAMEADELAAFEASLATDPAVAQMVVDFSLLIQTTRASALGCHLLEEAYPTARDTDDSPGDTLLATPTYRARSAEGETDLKPAIQSSHLERPSLADHPTPRVIVIPRWVPVALAAAAITIVTVLALPLFDESHSVPVNVAAPPIPEPVVPIATLVSSLDAQWAQDAKPLNNQLFADRYELTSGTARLDYGRGIELIVQGPAAFEVVDRLTLRLETGQMSALVSSPAGHGFTVQTDTMQVVDLGTEFGIAIDPAGNTSAHVYQGEIEAATIPAVSETSSKPPTRLRGGDAVLAPADQAGLIPGTANELAVVRIQEYEVRKKVSLGTATPAERWLAHSLALRRDPTLLAYYSFDQQTVQNGLASNLSVNLTGQLDAQLGDGRPMTVPTATTDRFGTPHAAMRFDRKKAQAVYIDEWPQVGPLEALTISAWFRASEDISPWALLVTQVHDRKALDGGTFCFHLALRDASRLREGPEGQTTGLQVGLSIDGQVPTGPHRFLKDQPRVGETTDSRDDWTHVVLTIQAGGGDVRLYKNGAEVDANGATYRPKHLPLIGHPLVIGGKATYRGAAPDTSNPAIGFFHGEIDDVALWSRSISFEEIQTLYETARPVSKDISDQF